jgi:hypothetical protein
MVAPGPLCLRENPADHCKVLGHGLRIRKGQGENLLRGPEKGPGLLLELRKEGIAAPGETDEGLVPGWLRRVKLEAVLPGGREAFDFIRYP